MERKKNEEIKGWIQSSSLILVYMIHLPTVQACTNFQPSRPHHSREKCEMKGWIRAATWFQYTRYIHLFSTCVTSFNLLGLIVPEKTVTKNFHVWIFERKKNEKIKGYTIHLPIVHMCTKFQSSRPHSFWEKCDEKFQCLIIGEKETWRNKGMNMQKQPDSGKHDTSAHCPCVYQVSVF